MGGEDHVVGGAEDHVVGGEDATMAHTVGAGQDAGARDETTGADPLVGLRAGDGLVVGTWQRRPRVKLLQYRLNQVAGAALAVDGMWGHRTSSALEGFQLARGIVPEGQVDARTAEALQGGAPSMRSEGGTTTGGEAMPDISALVAPDVLARWQAPLLTPPGGVLPEGHLSGMPGMATEAGGSSGGPVGDTGSTDRSALTGGSGERSTSTSSGQGGGHTSAGSAGIRTDPDTLARFERYKPVLYDMWYRYDRAYKDTQAYLALVQQSAAIAGYWAAKAFSSVCASLAGIVLGPAGVTLWTMANQFWGLGPRVAEEAQRAILEASVWPAVDAIAAFGSIVQESFDRAYPMQTPDMPWYVVGAGSIQAPTASLLHAYGQLQRLRPS